MTRMLLGGIDVLRDEDDFSEAVLSIDFTIDEDSIEQEGNMMEMDITFNTGAIILADGRTLPVIFKEVIWHTPLIR